MSLVYIKVIFDINMYVQSSLVVNYLKTNYNQCLWFYIFIITAFIQVVPIHCNVFRRSMYVICMFRVFNNVQ